MSAAITVRFAEKNGSTTLFAAQFVALDKPTEDNDLYTMVRLRSGSLDAAAPRNGSTSTRSTPRLRGMVRLPPARRRGSAERSTPPRSCACTRTTNRRKRRYSRRTAKATRASIPPPRTFICIARAEVVTKEFASPPPAAERRDAATPRPADVPRRGRETGRGPTCGDAAARGCAAPRCRCGPQVPAQGKAQLRPWIEQDVSGRERRVRGGSLYGTLDHSLWRLV